MRNPRRSREAKVKGNQEWLPRALKSHEDMRKRWRIKRVRAPWEIEETVARKQSPVISTEQ
jgi:hypothetical protein